MKKDGKKLMPLIALVLISSTMAIAATLWVLSLTANVSLVANTYYFKSFSDDACTLPITSIDFGAIQQTYTGNAVGEWKPITLQAQTPITAIIKYFINPTLTGTLPTGATIECQKQKYDLTWETVTFTTQGSFQKAATAEYSSPLVNGLQVQRFKYRIAFSAGSVPVVGSFGITYTLSDIV